nr:MAG TPA: hypothetical protein [Caudoviricetes sp.]
MPRKRKKSPGPCVFKGSGDFGYYSLSFAEGLFDVFCGAFSSV